MSSNADAASSCQISLQPCGAGCFLDVGRNSCVETPQGFFSPIDDDNFYICPEGTFADQHSAFCKPCPPGTFSWGQGFGTCFLCGPGTFADQAGSTSCKPCNFEMYLGPGTFEVLDNGESLFCLDPITMTTSLAPTVEESSISPSTVPTKSPAPSQAPSKAPIWSPTLTPSRPPTLFPTLHPTIFSPTQTPTYKASMIDIPTFFGFSFPKNRNNLKSDGTTTKSTKPPLVIRNKSFLEAGKDYLPLMVLALLFFVIGFIYRKLFRQRKTRRPRRTIPAPPTSDDEEEVKVQEEDMEYDPEAPSTKSNVRKAKVLKRQEPILIPKRAGKILIEP